MRPVQRVFSFARDEGRKREEGREKEGKREIGDSQRSQVVVQSTERTRESSTLSFVVDRMTNFKVRGDSLLARRR